MSQKLVIDPFFVVRQTLSLQSSYFDNHVMGHLGEGAYGFFGSGEVSVWLRLAIVVARFFALSFVTS